MKCPFDKKLCENNRICQAAAGDGESEDILWTCERNPHLRRINEGDVS